MGEETVFNWEMLGSKSNTQFSITIEDETEPNLVLKTRDRVVESNDIKSILFRKMYNAQNFGKPKEDIPMDEFKHMMLEEFYPAFSLFLKGIFMMNDPSTAYLVTKVFQYMRAKKRGLVQPDTLISNDAKRVIQYFMEQKGNEKVLFKHMEIITMEGQARFANLFPKEVLEGAAEEIKEVPGCWQDFCPKVVEYRTTAVNGKIYNTKIESLKRESTTVDFKTGQSYSDMFNLEGEIPEIREGVKQITEEYGLAHGVYDFIKGTDGLYYYIECNEFGQYLFHTRFTGADIIQEYAEALIDAKIKPY